MLNKIKNHAKEFLASLANSPARASKAVFSSMLLIALTAFTLDLSPRVFPQALQGRLLNPLSVKESSELVKNLRDTTQLNQAIRTCYRGSEQTRIDNAQSYLSNFEESFGGVLPGVGNLLLEYPSTVEARKEQLIFTIMQGYSNKKFCIPEYAFKPIYFSEYQDLVSRLDTFTQVRLVEKGETDLNNVGKAFISDFTQEYALVEKDLKSTQKYVEDVIENAIQSAIELDQQTQTRITNLSKQTTNALLDTILKQGNENIEIANSASTLLEAIRNQDASESVYGMTTTSFMEPKSYSGSTHEAGINASAAFGAAIMPKVSYGLLNLLDKSQRENFMQNHYAIEMAFYLAAKNAFDPLAPGAENVIASASSKIAANATAYKSQAFYLENKEANNPPANQNNVVVSSGASSPTTASATGVGAGTPNAGGGGGGGDGIMKVDVVRVKGAAISDNNPVPVHWYNTNNQ